MGTKVEDHTYNPQYSLFEHTEASIDTTLSLDDQLKQLVSLIILTEKEVEQHMQVAKELEELYRKCLPGCKILPFGSTVSDLAVKGSDIDMLLDTSDVATANLPDGFKQGTVDFELTHQNVFALIRYVVDASPQLSDLVVISRARVPLLKFVASPNGIKCDLIFNDKLPIQNSRMIKMFVNQIDGRVKNFLMTLRYWMKKQDLGGTGKITNYAATLLGLFYLQRIQPPVLPSLANIRTFATESDKCTVNNWICTLPENTNNIPKSVNTLSAIELVYGFFKFYSEFDFARLAVCILTGTEIRRDHFKLVNIRNLPKEMNDYKVYVRGNCKELRCGDLALVVQDPIELTRNVGDCTPNIVLETFKLDCRKSYKKYCQFINSSFRGGLPALLKLDELIIVIPLQKYGDIEKEMFQLGVSLFHESLVIGLLFHCIDENKTKEPERKKLRLEKEAASTFDDTIVTFTFQSNTPTWLGREETRKEIENVGKDIIDREAAVSHKVKTNYHQAVQKVQPQLCFNATCTLITDDLPKLRFQLIDTGSSGTVFQDCEKFLYDYVTNIFNKY